MAFDILTYLEWVVVCIVFFEILYNALTSPYGLVAVLKEYLKR